MVERLWRTLKYDCVYLSVLEGGAKPERTSADGPSGTTGGGRTPAWTAGSRMRHNFSRLGAGCPVRTCGMRTGGFHLNSAQNCPTNGATSLLAISE